MGRIYKQKLSDFYFADYVDEDGKRVRKSTKCTSKRKAEEQLAAWENFAREIRGGLRQKVVEHPIEKALDEYQQSSHNSEQHIKYTRLQVERVVEDQHWTNLSDINAAGLEAFIAGMDAANRTKHSHITVLRTFCRWCVSRGKLPADPTATVRKPPVGKSDRRMIEQDEWKLLRKYLESSDVHANHQDAAHRLLMYWVAVETGLRSKELLSLTRADVVDNIDEPYVLCDGVNTKNSRDAKQFISDELAKKLKKFVSKKLPVTEVFTVGCKTRMAGVLRKDCVEAGIKNTEVLDFHCLRHTTGSWLASAGVPLHEVQRIMRHSTITLTIDRYGHLAKGTESRNRNILGKLLA
jgi:integrase